MIKFILSFTLVLNSISYSFAANSVFYFNPNLTMRVATNDSELDRRAIINLIQNEEFKGELDKFLGLDSRLLLRSIEKNKFSFNDYLTLYQAQKISKNGILSSPEEGLGCEGSTKTSEDDRSHFANLALNQSRIITNDAANRRYNRGASDILFDSLRIERVPPELMTSDRVKILAQSNELNIVVEKLRNGSTDEDDLKDGVALVDKINLNSKMVKDMLSDKDYTSFIEFKLLPKEEQLTLLRERHNNAVGIAAVVVIVAVVAVQYAAPFVASVRGICSQSSDRLINYRPEDLFDPGKPQPRLLEFLGKDTVMR